MKKMDCIKAFFAVIPIQLVAITNDQSIRKNSINVGLAVRRLLYLFFSFACFIPDSYAQKPVINFTSLTLKDGLSANVVTAILKDKYGLMWFATEDGLNKYNGNNFTVYRHSITNNGSILSNDIRSLHEDKAGNLWIGTNGGGLNLYDRKTDSFKNINYLGGNDQYDVYRAICSDYLDQVWVGTSNGLIVFNPLTNKTYKFPYSPVNGKLSSKAITCIFEDGKRRIWVGSEDGLFLYNRKLRSFYHYSHSTIDTTSLSNNYVQSVTEDKGGHIWVGTRDGLNMLMPDARKFKLYKKGIDKTHSLSNNIINSLAVDNEGKLWVGTSGGLNILDISTGGVKVFMPSYRNTNSVTSKSIKCVYIDNAGISWLGTFRGGINKYDKNLNLFNLKSYIPFDKDGLSAPIVTSFAEIDDDNIFVGTDGGGLNLFNRNTELFKRVNIQSGKTPSNDLAILALKLASDKKLWIGTYSKGLFVLDHKTGGYQHYSKSEKLSSDDIFCIEEDSKGNIWIGTNGGGVNVYHPKSKSFTYYKPENEANSEYHLPINGYIRSIAEDASGNIWIGSYGSGLAILNPITKKIKVYDKVNSKLTSNFILSLLIDKRGNLWAGTMGGGICMLDAKTHEFSSLSERDGLANGVVCKIVQDQNELLWLSTNVGISSLNPKTKKIHNYNYYNGVQNNNFVPGSGLRLADGEVFFGGLEGFNHFYPENIRANNAIPTVLITDLKVDNESVISSKGSPIEEHISVAKQINLDYKQSFAISFVSLSYTTPQQYSYSYKLNGFDETWNNVGSTKTSSYTNIDPGDYVFQVRARSFDGLKLGKITSLKIHVEPPFWRSIYAYTFYILALLSLLFYIRYRGIQKLKKGFKLEQQRNETERLRELERLKIKFLTNLSHEFRTPISLIMGPVDKLLLENKDDSLTKQISMIKRNGRRLLNLVNQLLDFRKMEEHELKLNIEQGEIVSFIEEVLNSFTDVSERKNIRLILESRVSEFYCEFDHDKVERILFNLLSNAFKFTPEGGRIVVELDQLEKSSVAQQKGLIIKVTDTGIGIPEDSKEKIFEHFFQGEAVASVLNQGSGIGLSITKEFVQMHGGTIEVKSEPGKGTTFSIYLPLSPINKQRDIQNSELQVTEFLPEPLETVSEEREEAEFNKPVILLVEDNDDFRFYLKDNLKKLYKVYEASDGKEGWQKVLAHHPQVIIADISMPFMNGIELCEKVKKDKRTNHTPVILLTALTAEKDQIEGLKIGANDYITKPFNFEILNAKIKNMLLLNRNLKETYSKQIKIQTPDLVIELHDERLLNKVLLYIEENLNKPELSVEDLSNHLGMTRGTLYHKILELTGQSPVEYIRSVKLDKAAVLLEKSDMNVAEIAYAVGFGSPNYFAKSFKGKFNISPTEYIAAKRNIKKVQS